MIKQHGINKFFPLYRSNTIRETSCFEGLLFVVYNGILASQGNGFAEIQVPRSWVPMASQNIKCLLSLFLSLTSKHICAIIKPSQRGNEGVKGIV